MVKKILVWILAVFLIAGSVVAHPPGLSHLKKSGGTIFMMISNADDTLLFRADAPNERWEISSIGGSNLDTIYFDDVTTMSNGIKVAGVAYFPATSYIAEAIADSSLVTKKYVDDAVVSGIAPQSVKATHVDSTGETFIMDGLSLRGDSLRAATNTDGHLWLGDGTDYNPHAMSGDATIDGTGDISVTSADRADTLGASTAYIFMNGDTATVYDGSNTLQIYHDGADWIIDGGGSGEYAMWVRSGDSSVLVDGDDDTIARFWDNDGGNVRWWAGADQTLLILTDSAYKYEITADSQYITKAYADGLGGTGEVNTLVDSGTFDGTSGFGLSHTKVGTQLRIRGLVEGDNVTLTYGGSGADDTSIVISSIGAFIANADTTYRLDETGDTVMIIRDDNSGNVTWDVGAGQSSLTIGGEGITYIDTALAIGDTATGDIDIPIYFSTNGSFFAEFLKWDDGESEFQISDDLDITGELRTDDLTSASGSGLTIGDDVALQGFLNMSSNNITNVSTITATVATAATVNPTTLTMPDVTSGKLLIADGSDYEEIAMQGDATIIANGTVTIGADKITTGKILDNTIKEIDLNILTIPGPSEDGYVLTYVDATGNFDWIEDQTGGSTQYDNIGNPSDDGSIAFGAYTGTYTSATDAWGGLIIHNTIADMINAGYLLTLRYDADGDDSALFLRCQDNTSTDRLTIKTDGRLATAGVITSEVSIISASDSVRGDLIVADTMRAPMGTFDTLYSDSIACIDLAVSDDVVITGDATAGFFIGDGSQLTNIGGAATANVTFEAKVNEGGGISIGQAVYISGATGQSPQVSLVDNTVDVKYEFAGLAAQTKTDGQTILIRAMGLLEGLDTDGTGVPGSSEDWNDGDPLYLSTGGLLTKTMPSHGVVHHVATVAYDHGSAGKLLIGSHPEPYLSAPGGVDIDLKMGDDGGSTKVSFEDSTDTEVAAMDSDGNLTLDGTVDGIDVSDTWDIGQWRRVDSNTILFYSDSNAANMDTLVLEVVDNVVALTNESGAFSIQGLGGAVYIDLLTDGWVYADSINVTNLVVNAGLDVTGNIVVSGTVDGVDIAAFDGATFDSSEVVDTAQALDVIADNVVRGEIRDTINADTLDFTFNLFDPDAVYAGDHEVSIVPRTRGAITIRRLDVTLDADPTTEMEYSIKFADAFIGFASATVIVDTATVAGVTTVTAGWDDATVPANKCIYFLFDADPDDDITQASIQISYTVD